MMSEGIYYERIFEVASDEEKIKLCPEGTQDLLRHLLSCSTDASIEKKILDSCIDISVAIRQARGFDIIFSLIKRFCEKKNEDIVGNITSYIDELKLITCEDELRKALVENPQHILKFLKYPTSSKKQKPTENKTSDKFENIKPNYELRYYQLVSARKIVEKLNKPQCCVMYHAPTGSGKTRTAMAVVTQHLREYGPTTVLWLASSSELINQAASAFREAWKNHGDISCCLRLWHEDAPEFRPEHEPKRNNMIIVGLQKAASAYKKHQQHYSEELSKIVSLIVFDEAHQSVAPTYKMIIDGLERCKLLGLSATPGRVDDKDTENLVDIYKGEKVLTYSPGNKNPIDYLVEESYLARARFHKIFLCGEHKNKIKRDSQVIEKTVETVHKAMSCGHKRILVFSPSVDSARVCSAMLEAKYGVRESHLLTAETSKDKRENILDRYSSKDESVFVIFNYGILTTGFDAPCTSAAVIARSTDSVGLYLQMVGRALRGTKSGGNKNADIYTILDANTTNPEFSDIVKFFENWDAQWKG